MNGVHVGNDGIRITEGAQLSGARIRIAYGTGVVRGQTVFQNGTLPPGMRIIATARPVVPGAEDEQAFTAAGRRVEADVRGLFRIEGLPAGEYEVFVNVFGNNREVISDRQRVTVADGAEVSVSPTVDLNKLTPPPPPRVVPPNP